MQKSLTLIVALVAGLHIDGYAAPVVITKEFADYFVRNHEFVNSSQSEKWSSFVSERMNQESIDTPGFMVEWVQPLNKKMPCKIFFGGDGHWKKPGFKAYWDGDCQNGRAYGIGREFAVSNGELVSSLADYSSEQKAPKYYLNIAHDRQAVELQVLSSNMRVSRTYTLHTSADGKNVRVETSVLDREKGRLYQAGSWLSGDTRDRRVILPNEQGYGFQQWDDGVKVTRTMGPVTSKGYVGFVTAVQELAGNTVRKHNEVLGPNKYEEVVLPENWTANLTSVELELETAINRGDQMLQESYIAVNRYKRKICRGDVKVDFVDSNTYGQICLPEGDLSMYSQIAEKQKALKQERHAKAQAAYTIQLGQAAQQRREQQTQIARQRTAAANQNHGDDFADSVKSFENSMETLRRDATDYTRSYQNANPSRGVQFRAPETQITNCMVVGNFVQCR